jgi:hypothetical protein
VTTNNPVPTCWIIDDDRRQADELHRLLRAQGYGHVLGLSSSVAGWEQRPVDCLFIRISQWDDYLKIGMAAASPSPMTVIFLSGEHEKCTGHLADVLDFHLQPPYRASRLGAIFHRRAVRNFEPRSLDFFFLKIECRFEVIYFSRLLRVRGRLGWLTIQTRDREYHVSGTLAQFQRRLPVPSNRVNRHLLLIHD